MTWEEVCADPSLRDLPYKIELNRWGNIEMSPPNRFHAEFQARIAHLLQLLRPDGVVTTECPVDTPENVKVPDVAWISRERRSSMRGLTYTTAPEICVEVVSPSNSAAEFLEKKHLYFQAGAQEFWLCDETGGTRFFERERQLDKSRLCPEFPSRIVIG